MQFANHDYHAIPSYQPHMPRWMDRMVPRCWLFLRKKLYIQFSTVTKPSHGQLKVSQLPVGHFCGEVIQELSPRYHLHRTLAGSWKLQISWSPYLRSYFPAVWWLVLFYLSYSLLIVSWLLLLLLANRSVLRCFCCSSQSRDLLRRSSLAAPLPLLKTTTNLGPSLV